MDSSERTSLGKRPGKGLLVRRGFLVLFIPLLLLLGAGRSALAAKPGDVNRDSCLSFQDMRDLLRHFVDPALPAEADVNRDGREDILDALDLVRLYSVVNAPPPEPDSLEVVPILQLYYLCSGLMLVLPTKAINVDSVMKNDSAFTFQIAFRQYANKELSGSELSFGDETFPAPPDSLWVTFRTSSYDSASHFFHTDSIPWSIQAVAVGGQRFEQSGRTAFSCPGPGVLLDYGSCPFLGDEIPFPLVLRGPWQRFAVRVTNYLVNEYSIEVDLNPEGADSVVFADIDSLATAIMREVVLNDPAHSGRFLLVSPAVEISTGIVTRRLILDTNGIQSYPTIIPLDGNRTLLHRLGLPEWRRKIYPPYFPGAYQTDSRYVRLYCR